MNTWRIRAGVSSIDALPTCEAGASGQISLGKKYAGKLFDVICHPGDRFELIPVRIVATTPPQTPPIQMIAESCIEFMLGGY